MLAAASTGLCFVGFVGFDNAGDKGVTHHILRREIVKGHAFDTLQNPFCLGQTRRHTARQIDLAAIARNHHTAALAQTGQEHFHLHGRGILRLVQNDKGI